MKKLLLLLSITLCSTIALARESARGFCEQGATVVVTGGLSSTNQVQGSFPSCTVTVNIHGGGLATIFSDNFGTPLANPFTATTSGQWQWYADNGRYDITLTGGGGPVISVPDVVLNDSSTISGGICTLAFSATPTFNASTCSTFSMTLTGNVTSSTISGGIPGQIIAIALTQGAGGPWTFAWPGTAVSPPTLTPTAAKSENFVLVQLADTNWHFVGEGEYPLNQIASLTGTGSVNVMQQSPTINTPTIISPSITSPTTTGTDSGVETLQNKTIQSPAITSKVINNIQIADQNTGADWCAKVTAADTALGSASGEIWVSQLANTGGACAAAPTLSANHLLRFTQGGVYSISVGWTQNNASGWGIVGAPGTFTFISFTGASGFLADGTAFGNDMQNITIKDVVFSGNAGIATAATFHNVARSTFENMLCVNATTNGCWFRGLIISSFKRTGSSVNILVGQAITYTVIPTNFVNFDANVGATSASIANTGDVFAECGGNAKTGINFNDIVGSVMTVTASEGCSIGVNVGGAGFGNTLLLGDIESNTVNDLLLAASRNRITIRSGSNVAGAITISNGANDNWISGETQNLVINSVSGTHLENFAYSASAAGGTITDNSSPVTTTKLKVKNANLATYDTDLGPSEQIAELQISLHSANAAARNWCLVTEGTNFGFFELWKSTNNTASNCFEGSAVMQFDVSGNLNIIGFDVNSSVGYKNNGNLMVSAIAPTIAAAGCGGGAASIPNNNGTAAFEINVGTTPGSACTVTMPAAAHGWACSAVDVTTNSTSVFLQKQAPAASQTATQIVITNFNDVAVATAFVARDVMRVMCHGY